MKAIDIRFNPEEIDLLRSLVGKKLLSVLHDPFTFVNSSSQIVQLNAEEGIFYLYSFTEPLDYFGSKEDVAVWSFEKERCKAADRKNIIETPCGEKIVSVSLVQEHQCLFKGEEQLYDVRLTRGLIIDFGDHQLSFEKAVWFSEDIYIRKGNDLLDGFAPVSSFVENDWEPGIHAGCSREVLRLE